MAHRYTDEDVAEMTPNLMSQKARTRMRGEMKRGVQTKAMHEKMEGEMKRKMPSPMKRFHGTK